jgi:hypothetical protein
MLGLALLYFIWKYYSELAVEHGKNKWAYALLGIACYYGGSFLAGIIIGLSAVYLGSNFMEDTSEMVLGLIALPFGILTVWGVYKILQRRWSKEAVLSEGDSLDSDLIK